MVMSTPHAYAVQRSQISSARADAVRSRLWRDYGVSAFQKERKTQRRSRTERMQWQESLTERPSLTRSYGRHYKTLKRKERSSLEDRGNLRQQRNRRPGTQSF